MKRRAFHNVTKVAQAADKLVTEYRASGSRNDDLMGVINSELKRHPAPNNVDVKNLSQLLIGKWNSPRRTYVFQANHRWGTEGGSLDGHWRIRENKLVEDGSQGTIILLNRDYFIYMEGDAVAFHSRVKE